MAKCPINPVETLESSRKRREMVSQVAKKTWEANLDQEKTSFLHDVGGVSLKEFKSLTKDRITPLKNRACYWKNSPVCFIVIMPSYWYYFSARFI
jgi:hypothetical protein